MSAGLRTPALRPPPLGAPPGGVGPGGERGASRSDTWVALGPAPLRFATRTEGGGLAIFSSRTWGGRDRERWLESLKSDAFREGEGGLERGEGTRLRRKCTGQMLSVV